MSFLKNILGKRKQKDEGYYEPLKDYSVFGTDIHSHLIPGIDDGSKTLEESITLVKAFAELGYKKLITTPHIISDAYPNTPEIILNGLAELRKAVAAAHINIEIDAAAEYYLDENLSRLISEKKMLTLNGKYLLFEISYMNPPDRLLQIIFELNVAGYIPVLAHPERYLFWYDKFDQYYKLKEAGALFQLNMISLSGYYGPQSKELGERMIDENMIDFTGSDLHGMRHADALKRTLKEKHLWKLAAIGVKNMTL